MDTLRDCLYVISNALLLPTLIAVLILTAWIVVLIGGFVREWFTRREVRATFRGAREALKSGGRKEAWARLHAARHGIPARFARTSREWGADAAEQDKCLEDLECDVAASLAKLSWITRIGPMLGLMGTLIPLGPALTGLAGGNITTLSNNLVVAFTTTVVGVFIGCAGFTMGLIRRHWYDRDMGDLEYIVARLKGETENHAKENEKVG